MELLWYTQLVVLLVTCIAPVRGVSIDVSVMCEPSANCTTLNDALMGLASDTTLELESGVHFVSRFALVSGLHDVSFIGEGDVTISCAEDVGLAFVNVSDLSFENIVIDGCGLTGRDLGETVTFLKQQFVRIFIQIPLDVRVGVFIGHCSNLRMEEVTVANTSGLGLVGINVLGNSLLRQVDFLLNIRQADCRLGANLAETSFANISQRIGGGAYFLYTDSLSFDNYRPTLRIQESNFTENSECSVMGIVERSYFDTQLARDVGYTIGGGGGLTIILAQAEYGVEIASESCLFQNNTARDGAGVHIGIFTGVHDSHVVFRDCNFFRNGFPFEDLATLSGTAFTTGAAGMAIVNDLIRPTGYEASLFIHNRSVSVDLQNCDFSENGAIVGGGLTIYSTYTSAVGDLSDVSTFQLSGCTFRNNSAFSGAALTVTELKLSGRLAGIQVQATDLTVVNNRGITSDFGTTLAAADNPSAIDLRAVNFTLRGDSNISFNKATGLTSILAVVGVVGEVTFESNVGVFGGALNLFTFSYLIVTRDSEVRFLNNYGSIQGGAIFVSLPGSLGGGNTDDCFLYFGYEDYTFCNNCSNLNDSGVSIEFSGNVAPSGGIIYGSGLESCPWARPLKVNYPNTSVVDILHTYYPNVFSFDRGPRGVANIITTSVQLVAENLQPSYSVIPGESFNITVSALDSLQQNIPSVLSSYNLDTLTDQPGFFLNVTPLVGSSGFEFLNGTGPAVVSVRLQATENQSLSIILYTLDSAGRARLQVNVVLEMCPDGFYFNNNTRECECLPELIERGVVCDTANGAVIIPNRQWVGPVSDGEIAVHRCFIFYCELGSRTINVQNGTVDYDSQCAVGSNRSGILCGSCREGFSSTLGSTRCRRCSNRPLVILVVFLGLGILLVATITYLQITITEGALNGVLFYSNMVALYSPLLAPASPTGGNFIFAAFLTLNLGIETCFYVGMTPIQKVWWQLSFPLYLFFLMIVIALCARYCKWKQFTGLSIIQAFGTLMILCYISVLDYSFEILTSERITTLSGDHLLRWGVDSSVQYFRGVHGFLGVVGCLLMLLYIIPLPLFLMFPSLAYRAPWLKKFKPYYDSFWNPFKPKYRFWLGFRLIFRWVPFALAYFLQPPRSPFVTGLLFALLLFFQMVIQPFRKEWINILDSYFLFNLVVLFMGALYYSATDNPESQTNVSQSTAFSSTVVVFGYLGMCIMISYHIGKRFPRLKEWFSKCYRGCRRRRKTHKVEKVFVHTGQTEDPDLEREDIDGQETFTRTHPTAYGASITAGTPAATTFSELREPLLELEGTFEIVTLPPPSSN